MNDYLAAVRAHITSHLDGITPGDGEDLFATGYLNSLFAVQIVMWVEKEYGVVVDGDDLAIDNFRSINAIAGFIDRKKAGVAS